MSPDERHWGPRDWQKDAEQAEQAVRPVDPPSAQQALEEAVDKLRWLIGPDNGSSD